MNNETVTENELHPQLAPKKVKRVELMMMGHVRVVFHDDSLDVVRREEIAKLGAPKAGKMWPPKVAK